MKKILLALLLAIIWALPAYAVFSSKGVIPGGEPIEYRGLKITDKGVTLYIVNRSSEKAYEFSAALLFVTRNQEWGNVFIERITLEAGEHRLLTGLFLRGDTNKAKAAESLRWTIYTLEEKPAKS